MKNKNKVIVITRDEEAYKTLYKKPEPWQINIDEEKLLFPHYDTICYKFRGLQNVGTKLEKYFKDSLGIDNKFDDGKDVSFVCVKFSDWGKTTNNSIKFECLKDCGGVEYVLKKIKVESDIRYYYRFEDDDNIVTLFYFDRTLRKRVDNLAQFLFVICKDCGIDLLDKTQQEDNMLYIHDDEWGVRGNHLLLKEHAIKDVTSDKKVMLEALQVKFSYVAAFQHINEYGSIFRDILDCKFGKNPVALQLNEMEKKNKNFDDLLKNCMSNLDKA